jgi:glucan endo-1,3-alpha-glucosidase
MKPYIAAYKSGASAPTVTADQLVYWYRPTPWDVTCSGDPLGPPNGRDLLADVVFVTTLLTSPANLTVQSGGNAPVTIQVPAGIVTNNFTMGLGAQTFQVTRNNVSLMGGTGGLQITNTCTFYNYNAYVGSFNATGGTFTSTISQPGTSSSTSSSSTSTSLTPTSSSTSTTPTTASTKTTSTTTSSSPVTSSTLVCTAGTVAPGMSGNYIGLCNFCCEYGYCPPGPCVCTGSGTPIPTPPTTGVTGVPLSGEDNSYLGLCSFACSHGYCPNTACMTA